MMDAQSSAFGLRSMRMNSDGLLGLARSSMSLSGPSPPRCGVAFHSVPGGTSIVTPSTGSRTVFGGGATPAREISIATRIEFTISSSVAGRKISHRHPDHVERGRRGRFDLDTFLHQGRLNATLDFALITGWEAGWEYYSAPWWRCNAKPVQRRGDPSTDGWSPPRAPCTVLVRGGHKARPYCTLKAK